MIMVITQIPPQGAGAGNRTRQARLIEHLAGRYGLVHLVYCDRNPRKLRLDPALARYLASFATVTLRDRELPAPAPRTMRRATAPDRLWVTRTVRRGFRRLARRDTSLLEEVADRIIGVAPRVILCNYADLAVLLAHVPRRSETLWIVDTHDVLHERDASLVAAGLSPAYELTRDEETRLLGRFQVVLAIQDEEQRILHEMVPQSIVLTVGHAQSCVPQSGDQPSVGFLGGRNLPNLQGLLAFLREAWPDVSRLVPEARLEIFGGICREPELRGAAVRVPRVILRGQVADVATAYAGHAAMICPLWAGSGLKIKMVEALAHGKAVVATPIAGQGLIPPGPPAFQLAETPREFTAHLVELLRNPAARQAREAAALAYAAQRFSPQATYRELDRILGAWLAHGTLPADTVAARGEFAGDET